MFSTQFSIIYIIFDIMTGYKVLYEGPEREHVCDHLVPGHTYMIRVACCNAGGKSDVSTQSLVNS